MKEISLKIGNKGINHQSDNFFKLSAWVKENFDELYEGAVKIGFNIPADDYAGQRIQIGDVRINPYDGLKIVRGWHCRKSDEQPSDEETLLATGEVAKLVEAYEGTVKSIIDIKIKK